jgi:hypothetical protein
MVFTIKSQHNFFCDSFFQCGRWHIWRYQQCLYQVLLTHWCLHAWW